MVVALIADIVGSRTLPDRSAGQEEIEAAVARVERDFPRAAQTLTPTVGDEFQGVYGRLDDALCAVLLLQLALSDAVQCRFGVGVGEARAIRSTAQGIQDGPAWWAARAAIDRVHKEQQRLVPTTRTRVMAPTEEDADMSIAHVNAYLLARDQVVATMSERARRLTYGRCVGRTQAQLAAAEGITQSAVSQTLASAGAASVAEGFRILAERRP